MLYSHVLCAIFADFQLPDFCADLDRDKKMDAEKEKALLGWVSDQKKLEFNVVTNVRPQTYLF